MQINRTFFLQGLAFGYAVLVADGKAVPE
jgi:hypothetical protein